MSETSRDNVVEPVGRLDDETDEAWRSGDGHRTSPLNE
jgi:hypothetical protein